MLVQTLAFAGTCGGGKPARAGVAAPDGPRPGAPYRQIVSAFPGTFGALRSRPRRPASWRPDDMSVVGAVAKFAVTAFLAVVLIGVGGVVVIRHVARDEALREAREFSRVAGRGIAEPLVTPGVLRGDPAALARLDRAVHRRILGGGVVRVKIWAPDGRIVYSDAPRLIGMRYRLGADERKALRTDRVYADASDLSRPENRYDRRHHRDGPGRDPRPARGSHRLVEVYLSIHATDGTPVLFENYERSASITAGGRRRLVALAPALLGALLLLELVLVPLAWSMARRLRDRQREREDLLRHAIESSELERRRVAADLHDGPLQGLASLSLDLSAEADRLAPGEGSGAEAALGAGGGRSRQTIRELRGLLVEIYPPTLREAGLASALEDLTSPLAARGVGVTVDVPGSLALSYEHEALFFRAAQEALRNADRHAGAKRVSVLARSDGATARLVIADDGRGFLCEEGGPSGHFGLRLMEDLARDAGGELRIEAAPDRGTRVTLE